MIKSLKKISGHLFLNKEQKNIVNECIKENTDEYQKWYTYNVLFPIIILVVALCFVLIIEPNAIALLIMLLNGSLTILGISIIFTMLSYLLIRERSNKNNEEDKDKMENLYDKIFVRGIIFIILGAFLYIIQVSLLPEDISILLVILLLTVFVLVMSVRVGIRSFIIREEFYINVMSKKYKEAENTGDRVDSFKTELEID